VPFLYLYPFNRFTPTPTPTHTPFQRPSAYFSQRRSYHFGKTTSIHWQSLIHSFVHSFIHSFHTFHTSQFLITVISMVNCIFQMIFALHSLSPAVDGCCLPKHLQVFRARTSPEAIDLVSRLLEYTPSARITPLQVTLAPHNRINNFFGGGGWGGGETVFLLPRV
jgi:hypothetical protein